jgi:hypothetical protein
MAMRPLTSFEQDVANGILASADEQQKEFAALLEGTNGPLIGTFSSGRADRVDLSEDVLKHVKEHGGVIVHHNHLSQESLSVDDWLGLTEVYAETFAHCADGTIYWGRAIDRVSISEVLQRYGSLEDPATNVLFNLIIFADQNSSSIATFFRKEVINRAMRIRGYVEYEYTWGSKYELPHGARVAALSVHVWGKQFNAQIDEAAQLLAPIL